MLKVTDLKVKYGMIEAIKGISFEVRDGEIVTMIGANGAGKTTTMHAISGLVKAAEGSIKLDDVELTKTPANKIVGMGLAQVPEGRRVFAEQTVEENLILGAYLRKDKAKMSADMEEVSISCSPALKREGNSSPAHCPEASSRCWPWEGL